MSWKVLVAHTEHDGDLAEQLAASIRAAGYQVAHRGTPLIGDSWVEEAQDVLSAGGPVVLCGTSRAIGSRWARHLVAAARANPACRLFVVDMEPDADVERIAADERVARYWENPAVAVRSLLAAISRHYPLRASDTKVSVAEANGPASSAERERDALTDYLIALVRDIEHIRPGRIKESNFPVVVSLDDVYVELQAGHDRPDVDRRVTLEELAAFRQHLEHLDDAVQREQQYRLYARLDRYLQQRHRHAGRSEDLVEVVRCHRQVVMLGDPGSGKTTLLRYIALRLARVLLSQPERLLDGGDVAGWTLDDLGPVRVPVYVRVSEFAEARAKNPGDLTVQAHLMRTFAAVGGAADVLPGLMRRLLDEGRCIVLLDGLDEVIDDGDRRNVAQAIAQFTGAFGTSRLDSRGSNGTQAADRPANAFVVTSRIAGYRPFVELPDTFEHFTIQPMDRVRIEGFLERWCLAVELQTSDDAIGDVPERARKEVDRMLRALDASSGVRRMADNPLLLRTLAVLHRSEGRLPQRRAELYEEITRKMLYEWHLERPSPKGAAIDEVVARSLLGPVAMYIHENQPSGLLSPGQIEELLCRIHAPALGDDPERPSVKTIEAVRAFLKVVREHSGLLVERGAGLYGFVHQTFQEYYVARQLISHRETARGLILTHLHQPRWREPLLLAIGAIQEPFLGDVDEILQAILDAPTEHEPLLHRNLLFAADCIADGAAVSPIRRRGVARRLMAVYCERSRSGRFSLVRTQVETALRHMHDDPDPSAAESVEAALAETLLACENEAALDRALDIVAHLEARTPEVVEALEQVAAGRGLSRAGRLLVRARERFESDRGRAIPDGCGWTGYGDEAALARVLGGFWLYGWRGLVAGALGVPNRVVLASPGEPAEVHAWIAVGQLEQLAWRLLRLSASVDPGLELAFRDLRAVREELRGHVDAGGPWVNVLHLLERLTEMHRVQRRSLSRRELAVLVLHVADAAPAPAEVEATELPGWLRMLRLRVASMPAGAAVDAAVRAEWARLHARFLDLASSREDLELSGILTRVDGWIGANPAQRPPGDLLAADLEQAAEQVEARLGAAPADQLELFGRAILRWAPFGEALAPVVTEAIRRAIPVKVGTELDSLEGLLDSAARSVGKGVKDVLSSTRDPRRYLEAVAFLARCGDAASTGETAAIVVEDVLGAVPTRAHAASAP